VVGQALADSRLTSSLIADLHHVSGQVAAIAFAAAPGRICLITDAAACAGMPPGRYVLGGEPIELADGDGTPPVRSDGTIAGSALRMDSAVANMVATGIGLAEAVVAATRIPADLIGRPDLGRIAPVHCRLHPHRSAIDLQPAIAQLGQSGQVNASHTAGAEHRNGQRVLVHAMRSS